MTSSLSGAPSPAIPNPPAFSYAQAAKGHKVATGASAIPLSQTTSGLSTPSKDTNSAVNTPPASLNGTTTSNESVEKAVNGTHAPASKPDSTAGDLKSAQTLNSASPPTSPSFGTASTSTLPKEEEISLPTVSSSAEPSWRHTQSVNGNAQDRHGDSGEGRRAKKGKKQKNAEKEAEREAEKEKEEEEKLVLVAAPPPAVNIWAQRMESQKAKPSPLINQGPPVFQDSNEGRKKGKAVTSEEISAPIGGNKELSNVGKGQKKAGDSSPKGKEDMTKRSAPRGSRVAEKDEKPMASQLPPPVADAYSWPTPDTAVEDEKRKPQDKDEKDETVSHGPRAKKEWVQIPFVPTVNFVTPVPERVSARNSNRGGRGRGGRDSNGRGSHTSNGGPVGERMNSTSTTNEETETRGRGASTGTRSSSLPPAPKRPSTTDVRLQAKSGAAPSTEKAKNGKADTAINGDAHISLNSFSGDQSFDASKSSKGDSSQNKPKANNASVGGAADQKSDLNLRGPDQYKEGSKDIRNDARNDRGRGGFRGRGGHAGFPNGQPQQPQHAFVNGQGAQQMNGYPPRQGSNAYNSPQMQPMPFSQQYAPPASSRGGRSGRTDSRSQSIPNNVMYAPLRYGQPHPLAPIQTQNTMYGGYPPMQAMSAIPYDQYQQTEPHYSILGMVRMQLEYYFSIDNLCKDVFLRKHMDSQGFVFLNFLAGFKRLQQIAASFSTLQQACHESPHIQIVLGEDGQDRVRPAEGWETWVMAMEDRDESAKNDGPSTHFFPQSQQGPVTSPGPLSPSAVESRFQQPFYANGTAPSMNGNGASHHNHHPETPLTANVPSFAPSLPVASGTAFNPTGMPEGEMTLTDEQVENVWVISEDSETGQRHSSSSRTFSNGSIDGRSIAEEIKDDSRHGGGLTNGSRTLEQ